MPKQPAIYYIYVLTDPDSGAVRYVGKTKDPATRLRKHCESAARGGNSPVQRWIRSLAARDRRPVFTSIEIVTTESWAERESYWIAHYRELGCRLTNITDGGTGAKGWQPSTEWRQQLSQRFKLLWQTPEYREKVLAARRLPPERWSRDHDACMRCGRTDRKHAADGLCDNCYALRRHRQQKQPDRAYYAWSWDYPCCIDCGRTDRPHGGNGLCRTCYARKQYRKKHGIAA